MLFQLRAIAFVTYFYPLVREGESGLQELSKPNCAFKIKRSNQNLNLQAELHCVCPRSDKGAHSAFKSKDPFITCQRYSSACSSANEVVANIFAQFLWRIEYGP